MRSRQCQFSEEGCPTTLTCSTFSTPTAAMGYGSAYKPFRAARASCSNPSSTVSPDTYFRSHQHQPPLTSV